MAGRAEVEKTRIMIAVNESNMKGYPYPSISSNAAFRWILNKIIRTNTSGFKLLFLHVQIPDQHGIPNLQGTPPMPFPVGPSHPKFSDKSLLPKGMSNLKLTTPKPSLVRPNQPKISDESLSSEGVDDMDRVYASPDDFKNLKHQDQKRGLHLLEYFVDRCHALGIECEAWIKRGDPKEVILHEAKRVRPDLLVVGSRDLGPFQKVFVGTVSEFCAKHADCPVIIIKRSADETPQDPADD